MGKKNQKMYSKKKQAYKHGGSWTKSRKTGSTLNEHYDVEIYKEQISDCQLKSEHNFCRVFSFNCMVQKPVRIKNVEYNCQDLNTS